MKPDIKPDMKPEWLSDTFKSVTRWALGIAVPSAIIGLFLALQQPKYSLPVYLTVYISLLTLSLGALFWVIIFHLTRAGWSVVLRRIFEQVMMTLPLFILLFIPILVGQESLYKWMKDSYVATDYLVQMKQPYLNQPFFIIRSVFYFGIWLWLSRRFFSDSSLQDSTGNQLLTVASQKRSTYAILLYAITITFAAIDWIMTLTPHWYSTIFGVYVFAGAAVSSLCVVSLVIAILQRYKFLSVVTVEHWHDLGKLIYGFVVFWAYIGFSQYFLIWYANIPEETLVYLVRNDVYWQPVTLLLALGHFLVPFVLFMSRHMKRSKLVQCVMAGWLLIMHGVDIVWLILPTFYKKGYALSLPDVFITVAMMGLFIAYLFYRLTTASLFPNKDPRLDESLGFENV